MPYSRPTLSQLDAQAAQDIAGSLKGTDPLLRFSNLGIFGKIAARLANLHYGYQDWIAKMAVPWSSLGEYLLGWGALKGVVLKDATAAAGAGSFTGAIGAPIPVPAGTPVARGDGFAYFTTADAATDPGTGAVVLPLQAAVVGKNGNAEVGIALTLGLSIPGMQSGGAVSTRIGGGADTETMDSYKSRMLQVYQNTPQGGAVADYKKWALEVAGVTRAWVTPLGMGPGTVVVYTMWDIVEADNDGFPVGTDGCATDENRGSTAAGDQLIVADYIYGDDEIGRQPVCALVYSVAPIKNVVAFTIAGIAGVSAGIKAQIAAAIDGVFLEFGAPGGTIFMSDLEAAIAAVPGTEGFRITTPAGNIAMPTGNLPVRGAMTYT